MPKIYFFILIFLGIVIFATTDYFFNVRTTTSPISSLVTDVNSTEADSNLIQSLLNQDSSLNYQIANRNRTTYVFEKFDASNMKNIRIYRNLLEAPKSEKTTTSTKTNEDTSHYPIIIYEIHGPKNQGSLTYLNVKLKFVDQLSDTENINEMNEYGHNSFFYNDLKNKNTGFLLIQIGDNLFGFQYQKKPKDSIDTIKTMIKAFIAQK